jgi:alpha-tubulin suppressor-like RCC1 family protein
MKNTLLLATNVALFVCTFSVSALDVTWRNTVQVSATLATGPNRILLAWPSDPDALRYHVYRRLKDATTWGTALTTLEGESHVGYPDSTITPGSAYEYQIIKEIDRHPDDYIAYGYVYAGYELPETLMHDRGKILVLVDNTVASGLSAELARLDADLIGDGWTVIRRNDIPRHDDSDWNANKANLENVKAIITSYTGLKALLIIGHVTVPYSGTVAWDGHTYELKPDDNHEGAWATDVYYADTDGTWTDSVTDTQGTYPRNHNVPGDKKWDMDNFSPTANGVELQVGRIDLANLSVPSMTEVPLLQRYLNKNHDFRHHQGAFTSVPRRGLVGDGFGITEGAAGNAYRNYSAFFDPDASGSLKIAHADCDIPNPKPLWWPPEWVSDRWITVMGAEPFLWSYGCGSGKAFDGAGRLGTLGSCSSGYYFVLSSELISQNAKAVFTMLFGSWFGDWDTPDNFMRTILATETYGLTCSWGGRPHHFYHHMALGETIGYSIRLSQNNLGDANSYRGSHWPGSCRGIQINLMGDPTLRMHAVKPPSNLVGTMNRSGVTLNWTASSDPAVNGYHVYRWNSASGTFTRLTTAGPVSGTTYSDSSVTSGAHTYMVRARKLEKSGSGKYHNLSQGIFCVASQGQVAGAWFHSLAAKRDGTAWAWGDNYYGQIGNDTATDVDVPVQVKGPIGVDYLQNVVAVAAGGWHSLALKSDGTVWAWGYNYYGQLGNDSGTDVDRPVQVKGENGVGNLIGVVAIAAGDYSSYAVKGDGSVWAWGNNFNGQLGNGSYNNSDTPVRVLDIWEPSPGYMSGVVAISAGSAHCLALKNNGTVRSWGYNANGQLGLGNTTQSQYGRKVLNTAGSAELNNVIAISAGNFHSMALQSDGNGTVLTWGYDGAGQLGNGSGVTADKTLPIAPGLTGIKVIAAGGQYSMAAEADGSLFVWGANNHGQLGTGNTTPQHSPYELSLSSVTAAAPVGSSASHTFAVTPDGTLRAWGNNFDGQLGIDSTSPQYSPVGLFGGFGL